MEKIASFQVDHTKLKAGLYVSRVDRFPVRGGDYARSCPACKGCVTSLPVTTFDLRFVAPNDERHSPLEIAAMHTIEHLGATFLRSNRDWGDRVIYFGPMGCRTGFYLVLAGDLTPSMIVSTKFKFQTVRELLIGMCWFIMQYTADRPIPGATPEECGNYRDHNLLAARYAANNYYGILCQTSDGLGYDQFNYPK